MVEPCFCFVYLSFLRQLSSKLTEQSSPKTRHMSRSEYNMKMHVQNVGYRLALKSRAKPPIFDSFWRFRKLQL